MRLGGFAATGSKRIYGYLFGSGLNGLYYLAFDEAANTVSWTPVQGTIGSHTQPGVVIGLWGSDGGKLLVSRAEDNAGAAAVHWAIPIGQ